MGEFRLDNEKEKISHPYTVPDGYFDRFAKGLMQQLPDRKVVVRRQVTLWGQISPWVYIAAMLVGMVILFKYVMKPDSRSDLYGVYDVIRQDHSLIKKALSDMSEDEFFEIMEDHAASVSYYQTLLTDSNY